MKPIKNYEGLYSATEDGRIWSEPKRKRDGLFLSPSKVGNTNNKDNLYYAVQLSKDGLQKCKRVHRLVAETFIPNPDNLSDVTHYDGDKFNNHVSNLGWVEKGEMNKMLNPLKMKRQIGDYWQSGKGRWMFKSAETTTSMTTAKCKELGLSQPKNPQRKEGDIWQTNFGRWYVKEDGIRRIVKKAEKLKYNIPTFYKENGTIWQAYSSWFIRIDNRNVRIPSTEYEKYNIPNTYLNRENGDIWYNKNSKTWYSKKDGKRVRIQICDYEKYGITKK